VITPPLATDKKQIEVTNFFWYRCPHCFDFEPILIEWAKKLPTDVRFRRVPAILPNNKWAPDAKLYYTLEAMDLLDRLHSEVFSAIHLERQRLDEEKTLLEWVARKGIDSKKFSEIWNSTGVQIRVRRAQELTLAAGLTGVPAVMVHGRYLALTPGNYGELVANIDQLIERVRAEAAKK
jgi:thiol:disulfide interchange protein DsbA